MITSRTVALAAATALAVVACGGGGDEGATTAAPSEETTSTAAASTSTTIDPALRDLLLTAADVKGFKEETTTEPPDPNASKSPICRDPAVAPAGAALEDEPYIDGPTFVRGPDDIVSVSSSVASTTPEKAEAALKEVVDPKVAECLESDLRVEVQKGLPAGTNLTFKTVPTASTVPGTDQAILVASTATGKATDGSTITLRVDFVFLRKAGIILAVNYVGPTNLATSAERQRIVAIAARKLSGDTGGTSTTRAAGGSTTSTRRGSTTTRRSTSTSRQGTTSSNRTTSTT